MAFNILTLLEQKHPIQVVHLIGSVALQFLLLVTLYLSLRKQLRPTIIPLNTLCRQNIVHASSTTSYTLCRGLNTAAQLLMTSNEV